MCSKIPTTIFCTKCSKNNLRLEVILIYRNILRYKFGDSGAAYCKPFIGVMALNCFKLLDNRKMWCSLKCLRLHNPAHNG